MDLYLLLRQTTCLKNLYNALTDDVDAKSKHIYDVHKNRLLTSAHKAQDKKRNSISQSNTKNEPHSFKTLNEQKMCNDANKSIPHIESINPSSLGIKKNFIQM